MARSVAKADGMMASVDSASWCRALDSRVRGNDGLGKRWIPAFPCSCGGRRRNDGVRLGILRCFADWRTLSLPFRQNLPPHSARTPWIWVRTLPLTGARRGGIGRGIQDTIMEVPYGKQSS